MLKKRLRKQTERVCLSLFVMQDEELCLPLTNDIRAVAEETGMSVTDVVEMTWANVIENRKSWAYRLGDRSIELTPRCRDILNRYRGTGNDNIFPPRAAYFFPECWGTLPFDEGETL